MFLTMQKKSAGNLQRRGDGDMFWIKLFAKGCVWCAALISIVMGVMAAFKEVINFTIVSMILVIAAALLDGALRKVDDD